MNKQPLTVRLQLSVTPRHVEIIESLRKDYETNSHFIMRVLDMLNAKQAKQNNEVGHDD